MISYTPLFSSLLSELCCCLVYCDMICGLECDVYLCFSEYVSYFPDC